MYDELWLSTQFNSNFRFSKLDSIQLSREGSSTSHLRTIYIYTQVPNVAKHSQTSVRLLHYLASHAFSGHRKLYVRLKISDSNFNY